MNILIISCSNKGTIAKCSSTLYESLKKKNTLNVKLVNLYKYDDGEQILEGCDSLVDRRTDVTNNCSYIRKLLWLHKIKKEFRPDITISTLNGVSVLNVLSLGNEKKIGIFHAPKSQTKLFGIFYYFLTLLTYYFIFPFLDECFCVSNESKKDLESVPTISRKKIKVVYNIHNIERIRNMSLEPLDDIHSNIFSNSVILYCGRIDSNKAPKRAIDAIEKVNDEQLHLVIIGPDPYNLWKEIKKNINPKIRNRIHYLGSQSNPYKYMSRSKMLVSCSYSEGLPGVIIESLSLQIPVVATNSSQGVWEIFSNHKNFNPDLDSIIICEDGIITSNLSYKNSDKYDLDISNLAKGIEYVLYNKLSVPFSFSNKIKEENVIKSYLH